MSVQIVERNPFSVRTRICKFESRRLGPALTIIPILGMGSPRFFDQISNLISDDDLVVIGGVRGKLPKLLSKIEFALQKNPRINLIRTASGLSAHRGIATHLDISREDADKVWDDFSSFQKIGVLVWVTMESLKYRFAKTAGDYFLRVSDLLKTTYAGP